MKRQNHLYDKMCTVQSILFVYENEIRKNTKNKKKIEKFENYLSLNLFKVYEMLETGNVVFHPYYIFLIKEPKYRVIMSQSISDKLMNHLAARYLVSIPFYKSLLDENVAPRPGKGPHYGIRLLKQYIHQIKKEGKPIYYLKCDISKYFYSIDHKVLKDILRTKIKDKKALSLLDKIIDTTNYSYIQDRIDLLCKQEKDKIQGMDIPIALKKKKYQELDSIPRFSLPGKGIPIGNMTSQAFAIIYLNGLDHYIKEQLHVHYYIRYMDDFICLDTDKEKLKRAYYQIEKKLNEKFKLK